MIERDMDIRYADTVSDLTAYQRQIICAVYKHSKSLLELIARLSVIKFCDFETSVDVLVNTEYISTADKNYLLKEWRKNR